MRPSGRRKRGNMTFQDIFKSDFLENIGSISMTDMILSLTLAFLLGLFIFHRLLLWDAFADWANSASIV